MASLFQVISTPRLVHRTRPSYDSSLVTSSRNTSRLVVKVSASVEEGIKSRETGSTEESPTANSDPERLEAPPTTSSNPFAGRKISSTIVAKQADKAKQLGLEDSVPTAARPARPLTKSKDWEKALARPSSGQKPVSAARSFTKPPAASAVSGMKVVVDAIPLTKRPMVPVDWEKAGARPAGSGKRVLDAFREGDKQGTTTKFGQPLVPANIFDDVRRTPEEIVADAFKFEITPGQLFLVGSFLCIIGLMVGTAFLVWKVGAIHYNEY